MKGNVRRIGTEFAVIFAGVTLGLLADDWRQAQQTRGAEIEALSNLRADLYADSVQLNSLVSRLSGWSDAAFWINQSDHHDINADTVLVRTSPIFFSRAFRAVSPTYLGLKDSGGVGLVSDPDLRRRIVQYYEVEQPYVQNRSDYVGDMRLRALDVLLEYFEADLQGRTSYIPLSLALMRPWSEFRADPRARRSVERLGIAAGGVVGLVVQLLRANSELRIQIGARLAPVD